MHRGSRFALVTTCAYVTLAFACEEPRRLIREFDYTVLQQRNAAASVTGVWESDGAAVRVTICETDASHVEPGRHVISGRATVPLHVQVYECCSNPGGCSVAHACSCLYLPPVLPIEMEVMGGTHAGVWRGTAAFSSVAVAGSLNAAESSDRSFQVSRDDTTVSGQFRATTNLLEFNNVLDDAGLWATPLTRVGDASCP